MLIPENKETISHDWRKTFFAIENPHFFFNMIEYNPIPTIFGLFIEKEQPKKLRYSFTKLN